MTDVPVYLVAAFSEQPFAGNPAAVCLLREWLPDELLLKMAQQHNQSETAFVVPESDGFALRWFTTRNQAIDTSNSTRITIAPLNPNLRATFC